MTTEQENIEKATELLQRIGDEKLRHYTMMCLELLATEELKRDIDRASRASAAVMHEFHKEVSEGLLHAIALNLALAAFYVRDEEASKLFDRLVNVVIYDRALVDAIVHMASYAEVLAPACKREAERIQAEIAKRKQGSTDPTPKGKNRS